jgi:hypothetical protein
VIAVPFESINVPRLPNGSVVVCPNLTIREWLAVLRPGVRKDYFHGFDIVPGSFRSELALPQRKHLEIRFPIVEGYVLELKGDRVACDVATVEPIVLDPSSTPTAASIRPQVGEGVELLGEVGAVGGWGVSGGRKVEEFFVI